MPLRFAYETPDGVAIVTGAAKADLERVLGTLSDKEYREHVAKAIPEGVKYQELQANWTAPDDRTFRAAWALSGKNVTVDMERARGIFMQRVRAARNTALDKLDKDWTKFTGQGNTLEAQAVEAERQALRDLPRIVEYATEGATTTDDLKTLWPAALGRLS